VGNFSPGPVSPPAPCPGGGGGGGRGAGPGSGARGSLPLPRAGEKCPQRVWSPVPRPAGGNGRIGAGVRSGAGAAFSLLAFPAAERGAGQEGPEKPREERGGAGRVLGADSSAAVAARGDGERGRTPKHARNWCLQLLAHPGERRSRRGRSAWVLLLPFCRLSRFMDY